MTDRQLKALLVLVLAAVFLLVTTTGCSERECFKEALSTQVSPAHQLRGDKVTVCHNGEDLEVNVNALQAHLDHGDTEGSCDVLSDGGLEFRDGEIVRVECDFELPAIHQREDGSQWLFEQPKN